MSNEHSIPGSAVGKRLDHYLAGLHPERSRSQLQGWIRDGRVLLDGKPARPSEKIREGATVSVSPPEETGPAETRPEEIPLDVLYEDDDLVILNKEAGMVVHPAAGNLDGTLVNALLHRYGTLSTLGGDDRPGIVHRLDKETSGVMVVARNDEAHAALAAQFHSRDVTKIYLAIATGTFREGGGLVDVEMGRHPVHRKKMAVLPAGSGGRASKTEWRVLRELRHGTLVECLLHTGRTHQIRVHMKHINHPLAGDLLYGKRGPFARQMLHAWKLGFTHPRTGKRLDFEAPIPDDFQRAGVSKSF